MTRVEARELLDVLWAEAYGPDSRWITWRGQLRERRTPRRRSEAPMDPLAWQALRNERQREIDRRVK
jgi:hypothetical protein